MQKYTKQEIKEVHSQIIKWYSRCVFRFIFREKYKSIPCVSSPEQTAEKLSTASFATP